MLKYQIITPWNLPNYIPLNGFHNLYNSIFYHSREIEFITKELNKMKGFDFKRGFFNSNEKRYFDDSYKKNIFFHHTNTVNVNLKSKFIFHLESFLPLFMPLTFQGNAKNKDLIKAKKKIKNIFEHENCLAIFSNIRSTINDLNNFFDSKIIKEKIVYVKNSYPQSFFQNLQSVKKKEIDIFKKKLHIKKKDLIFFHGNSASGNSSQLELRGGIVSIKAALKLLKKKKNLKFIFRCSFPAEHILETYKINHRELEKYKKNFIWFDSFLTDKEIAILYKISHFFLLPGANLHSASILQSMISKTLPVILDTKGNEEYLNEDTSVFIKGYRKKIWKNLNDLNIEIDNHKIYINNIQKISLEVEAEILKILKNKNLYKKKIKECYLRAKKVYNSKINSDIFEKKILEIIKKHRVPKTNIKKKINCSEDMSFFFKSPRPVLIFRHGNLNVFKFHNIYYYKNFYDIENSVQFWNLNNRTIDKKFNPEKYSSQLGLTITPDPDYVYKIARIIRKLFPIKIYNSIKFLYYLYKQI